MGKPGMLQSIESQRIRHDWVTEQQLNKNERNLRAENFPHWCLDSRQWKKITWEWMNQLMDNLHSGSFLSSGAMKSIHYSFEDTAFQALEDSFMSACLLLSSLKSSTSHNCASHYSLWNMARYCHSLPYTPSQLIHSFIHLFPREICHVTFKKRQTQQN